MWRFIVQNSFNFIAVGKCEVHRNPDMNNPPTKVTAISVPNDNFNLTNGHLVKSYVLVLRATCPANKTKVNGYCNGDMSDICMYFILWL